MPQDLNADQLVTLIQATVRAGKPLSLLCDYDGTLTPIVDRPEDAVLDNEMREVLQNLAAHDMVRLAVISGRSLPVLQDFLKGLHTIEMIGDHGAAFADRDRFTVQAARYLAELEWLSRKYPGCMLEDKGFAVGVHFRQVDPDLAPQLMADFFDWWLASGNLADFQVATGKKVFEIRPRVKTNKGTAVLGLLENWFGETWTARTLAVYCGDDTTDEDAFAALEQAPDHAAATILVSEQHRPTRARFRVPQVPALQALFTRILDALPR